jgi:uncharacterized repeat protein (TIGR01451 family)
MRVVSSNFTLEPHKTLIMKALFTLLTLLICLTSLKAQFVTIPDANFVTWLQANVPSAMNGNQMDTTSLAVTTRTIIELEPTQADPNPPFILNYTGIQYFKGLKTLTLHTIYSASNLPPLPNSIENLKLTGFPSLTSLNSLPNNLKNLNVYLKITTLPTLPIGLESLTISTQYSFTWPQLPTGLKSLSCSQSGINAPQHLPSLPNGLKYLYCTMFQIDSLPHHLPDSLISLSCGMNSISTLPTLPNKLENLECNWSIFTNLPQLPPSLKTLYCNLSRSLTTLPSLPNGLKELSCNSCSQLIMPTILPDSLEKFNCSGDSLSFIPQLPNKLKDLRVSSTLISCIPTLPNSLTYIDILNNPISCLPNYLPIMSDPYFSFPLCTPNNTLTNPHGCERADGIFGSVYYDTNTNCIKDTIDTKLNNINFKLFDSNNQFLNQTTSYSLGMYNFISPTGNYTIVLDTLNVPYTAQCNNPGIDTTIQLTTINPIAENVDFSVKCKPGFDAGVQSVLTNGIVFPGQNHHLKIAAGDMSQWYNLNCAAGISGQVVINVSGPVTFIAPAGNSLIPIVSGTTFTYNIADFGNVNFLNDFDLILKTDTTATASDSICVSVNITPTNGDGDISNNSYNLCYGVVNSYDPNMKEVYPINVEPNYDDWFTYTIHFQNTGNAPAFNIRLIDTLDANLDLQTFKVINYSHNNTWSINHKVAFFNFQNIQLPDSTSDSEGSKGFIQYKIKPKSNLGAGTKIKNTAYIYFDYNSPIVTNTTINEYIQVVSVKENFKELQSFVYPNPTNGIFTIELTTKEKQSIQMYDITGNVVLSQSVENGKAIIDANHLAAGIYNISIKGDSGIANKKLVIVK